mmetsp:Transcript_21840/g.62231  ORF Transcript_21840/g.62231 Transcript_21840/m.62231 type:complete len:368 (+) Transcript_21840:233-1336(+)
MSSRPPPSRQAARNDQDDGQDDAAVWYKEQNGEESQEQADAGAFCVGACTARIHLFLRCWIWALRGRYSLTALWHLGRFLLLPTPNGRVQGVIRVLLFLVQNFFHRMILVQIVFMQCRSCQRGVPIRDDPLHDGGLFVRVPVLVDDRNVHQVQRNWAVQRLRQNPIVAARYCRLEHQLAVVALQVVLVPVERRAQALAARVDPGFHEVAQRLVGIQLGVGQFVPFGYGRALVRDAIGRHHRICHQLSRDGAQEDVGEGLVGSFGRRLQRGYCALVFLFFAACICICLRCGRGLRVPLLQIVNIHLAGMLSSWICRCLFLRLAVDGDGTIRLDLDVWLLFGHRVGLCCAVVLLDRHVAVNRMVCALCV